MDNRLAWAARSPCRVSRRESADRRSGRVALQGKPPRLTLYNGTAVTTTSKLYKSRLLNRDTISAKYRQHRLGRRVAS